MWCELTVCSSEFCLKESQGTFHRFSYLFEVSGSDLCLARNLQVS